MKSTTIYNTKIQANLPSGTYGGGTTLVTNPPVGNNHCHLLFSSNGTYEIKIAHDMGGPTVNIYNWDTLAPATTAPYEIRLYGTPTMPFGTYRSSNGTLFYSSLVQAAMSDGTPFDTNFIPIDDSTGVRLGISWSAPSGVTIPPEQAIVPVNYQIRDSASGPNGTTVTHSGSFTLIFRYQIIT